ncbi:MAG: glycoside hydrolase family 108 protein [Pseudonocardiaceae bacterium]
MTIAEELRAIVVEVVLVEDGFVAHPDDRGGPTKYGVTQKTLGSYRGRPVTREEVEALTVDEAIRIYELRYVVDPGFDKLAEISLRVAAEVVDTGVNMGVGTAGVFLQRALNALNARGELYPDLVVDGRCGSATRAALTSYLAHRNESALVKALNCLQGARYVELCEARERNESFLYGWLQNRVRL